MSSLVFFLSRFPMAPSLQWYSVTQDFNGVPSHQTWGKKIFQSTTDFFPDGALRVCKNHERLTNFHSIFTILFENEQNLALSENSSETLNIYVESFWPRPRQNRSGDTYPINQSSQSWLPVNQAINLWKSMLDWLIWYVSGKIAPRVSFLSECRKWLQHNGMIQYFSHFWHLTTLNTKFFYFTFCIFINIFSSFLSPTF